MLSKLKADKGIAGFLLANGALGDEDARAIRQKLITEDKVEAILPSGTMKSSIKSSTKSKTINNIIKQHNINNNLTTNEKSNVSFGRTYDGLFGICV